MTYPDLRILEFTYNTPSEVMYEVDELTIFINFKNDTIIIHEVETSEEVIFDSIPDDLKHLEPDQECELTEAEFYGYNSYTT